MEQRVDEFIEMFEGYEELNLGSITKGIVKDALLAWVENPGQNGIDTLIRHKWPEEKPDELGDYLVRMRSGIMAVLPFNDGCFYIDDYMLLNYMDTANPITHWWKLPGAKE